MSQSLCLHTGGVVRVTKKNKKSPLQGVGRIFFPDTDDETSRRFWGTYLPPPTPFEKTLFFGFWAKIQIYGAKIQVYSAKIQIHGTEI